MNGPLHKRLAALEVHTRQPSREPADISHLSQPDQERAFRIARAVGADPGRKGAWDNISGADLDFMAAIHIQRTKGGCHATE